MSKQSPSLIEQLTPTQVRVLMDMAQGAVFVEDAGAFRGYVVREGKSIRSGVSISPEGISDLCSVVPEISPLWTLVRGLPVARNLRLPAAHRAQYLDEVEAAGPQPYCLTWGAGEAQESSVPERQRG
jgi:hypothetical protein